MMPITTMPKMIWSVAASAWLSMIVLPMPRSAAMYSATLHYLKAIQKAGTDATADVMKTMKATPVNDIFAQNGKIREDGLHVHDMYLMQVKKPGESKEPWDYYNVLARVPADRAFSPMQPGAWNYTICPVEDLPRRILTKAIPIMRLM